MRRVFTILLVSIGSVSVALVMKWAGSSPAPKAPAAPSAMIFAPRVLPTPPPTPQGDLPDDAVSREFTVFRADSGDDSPVDAVSREFTVFRADSGDDSPVDAVSREFTVFRADSANDLPVDGVSREFTVFRADSANDLPVDAVSREFTVFHTTDVDAIPSDAVSREFTVAVADVINPVAVITQGPRPDGHVAPGPVTFGWTGTDNLTPPNQLLFQFQLDGGGWSAWAPTTQTTTSALGVGAHSFAVRAKDLAGNVQTPPTGRKFVVETTPPKILEVGVRDVRWNSAILYWRCDEPTRGSVRYGLQATNDFRFQEQGSPTLATYQEVLIKGLSSKTPYRFILDLTDEAGNAASTEPKAFTTAPLYDLSVRTEDITFSTPFPAHEASVTMTANVRNTGDMPLVANVDFYDKRDGSAAVLLGTTTVTLQPYTAHTSLTSPSFVVREPVHKPFVAIRTNRDDLPANNRADAELLVDAQPHRLTFSPPSVQTWPGDQQELTTVVRNTGSQAQTISDIRLNGVPFATRVSPLPGVIEPGESKQITFQVNTPANQTPGDISGQMVVVGAETYSQSQAITIHPQPVAQLQVRLTNARTGDGISNGIVVVGNDPRPYATGAGGYVVDAGGNPRTVAVPLGNAVVHGFAQNYMPKSGSVEIVSGSNALTISLEEGNALQITQITTTPLTLEQITSRGVNLEDPQNFWVYDFVIYMEIGAIPIYNVIAPLPTSTGGYSSTFEGGGVIDGREMKFDGTFTEKTTTWIITPGSIRILKQFWDASVTIQNRTSAFEIRDVDATLSLPNGIGLPDLFGVPQPTTKQLGTLLPGENKQAIWTIRGDIPGEYRLPGRSTGNLMLGQVPVPLESNLESAPLTVAAPSLDITLTGPDSVTAGQPFEIGVHVKNTSSIDLEFVQVNILNERLVNCHLVSDRTVNLGQLLRNETKTAVYTLIAHVTGVVMNFYALVTPPPVEPPVVVVPGRMRVLSVDDDDPRNPVIRYECAESESVVARIAGRVINLGPQTEGEHEFVIPDLDTVAPGVYQLEVDGLFQGVHLIDVATFDSSLYAGPFHTGSMPFQVGASNHTLGHRTRLIVRRWEWNIPGDEFTRFVVGAETNISTTLSNGVKGDGPTLSLNPPIGSIGSAAPFSTIPISIRGGTMTWSAQARTARVFTAPGTQFRIDVSGRSGANNWNFGGSQQTSFTVPCP
ncbi:MAG: hypothetical protein K1X67_04990 [Fimbriimonadaceae bacterium]|nr:hypothetical protein [Fimbriimonadaceae bacterium]